MSSGLHIVADSRTVNSVTETSILVISIARCQVFRPDIKIPHFQVLRPDLKKTTMGLRNRSQFESFNCFFVTTTCVDFKPLIHMANAYELISESLEFVNEKYNVALVGYALMPNHIHLILYFKTVNRLSDYMRDMKKFTSTWIRKKLEEKGFINTVNSLRIEAKKRTFQVWKDRFDDQCLLTKKDLEVRLDYIHNNPLQSHWNLVKRPEEYAFSSASYYEAGIQNKLIVTDYRDFF